jgi:ATP-binding cassette, subfamily F, member 3
MLSIQNLSFYFGGRAMYENANLHIKPKDRIGLIGANGTGKSTLLRLIVGEYTPDGGNISKSKECTIGFLNQDLLSYQTDQSILEVAMQAFEEAVKLHHLIDELLVKLEQEYSDEILEKLTTAQTRFDELDGYTIQAQAETILEGLGFSTADLQRPLQTFSGGWRMRVMLAKLLLQKPSLLLLDEPTNHMDMPSIQWLETYFDKYEGAIIIVSHDREFIDNIADSIVEVAQRQLVYYAGNYSFYVEEKALRQDIQKSAFDNQQQKIRQTERFIERFKAKASKARQVQSRVKALDRLDLIDDVIDAQAKVNFRFNFNQASGKQVFLLEDASKSYGDLNILKKTTANIQRGDKIALIGANGKGKSTMLRIISGTEPIEGKREMGYNVGLSFYAQHQLESLSVENTLIDELKQMGTAKTETELRNVLGCFLFGGEDVFKKIKVLSGGEKSRVALAKVLVSQSNFLLLDEPTNHLDMQSVNILIQALRQYEGTFVVVSHDRHFVASIANKIWYIENKEIKEYLGTYDEYTLWQEEREALKQEEEKGKPKNNVPQSQKNTENSQANNPQANNLQPSNTQNKKKLEKQLQEIEDKIDQLEKQKKNLENLLASQDIYNDTKKLQETQQKYTQIDKEHKLQQIAWEKIAEEIM